MTSEPWIRTNFPSFSFSSGSLALFVASSFSSAMRRLPSRAMQILAQRASVCKAGSGGGLKEPMFLRCFAPGVPQAPDWPLQSAVPPAAHVGCACRAWQAPQHTSLDIWPTSGCLIRLRPPRELSGQIIRTPSPLMDGGAGQIGLMSIDRRHVHIHAIVVRHNPVHSESLTFSPLPAKLVRDG